MRKKSFISKIMLLFAGQVFTAIGVTFMLQANIGLEPWSVLQQGLNKTTGVSFGTAIMIVSTGIILMDLMLGEHIGMGMIVSAVLCGPIIDFFVWLNVIPQQTEILPGIVFLLIGLELLAFGTYLGMRAKMGCGARDALMVAMAKRTNITVGLCRFITEAAAVLLGWLMGGQVGIGTILGAFGIGVLIELNFRLLHFNAVEVQHEYMADTFKRLLR